MRGLALHWKILIGMVFGVLLGLAATSVDSPALPAKQWVVDWIKPFGTMFINALKMIAIPLIVASLIKGVSDLKDLSKLSQMGLRTIGLYVGTTLIAVFLGLLIVNLARPGMAINPQTRENLVQKFSQKASDKEASADAQKEKGPL